MEITKTYSEIEQALRMCNVKTTKKNIAENFLLRHQSYLSKDVLIAQEALLNLYFKLDSIDAENKEIAKSII